MFLSWFNLLEIIPNLAEYLHSKLCILNCWQQQAYTVHIYVQHTVINNLLCCTCCSFGTYTVCKRVIYIMFGVRNIIIHPLWVSFAFIMTTYHNKMEPTCFTPACSSKWPHLLLFYVVFFNGRLQKQQSASYLTLKVSINQSVRKVLKEWSTQKCEF